MLEIEPKITVLKSYPSLTLWELGLVRKSLQIVQMHF